MWGQIENRLRTLMQHKNANNIKLFGVFDKICALMLAETEASLDKPKTRRAAAVVQELETTFFEWFQRDAINMELQDYIATLRWYMVRSCDEPTITKNGFRGIRKGFKTMKRPSRRTQASNWEEYGMEQILHEAGL
jgi:hypothetical protein